MKELFLHFFLIPTHNYKKFQNPYSNIYNIREKNHHWQFENSAFFFSWGFIFLKRILEFGNLLFPVAVRLWQTVINALPNKLALCSRGVNILHSKHGIKFFRSLGLIFQMGPWEDKLLGARKFFSTNQFVRGIIFCWHIWKEHNRNISFKKKMNSQQIN